MLCGDGLQHPVRAVAAGERPEYPTAELVSGRMGKRHLVSSHSMDHLSSGGHPCRWTSVSDHSPDDM